MKKHFYKKKVLITGHTGFKGSWLSLWMNLMGAKVLGISNKNISNPSNFQVLNLKKKIRSKKIDISQYNLINKTINSFKPDYIFHLAAEAIVKKSFLNPKKTWESNVIGTVNILETLRNYKKKVTVIIITSDKVYKNLEISRGYVEDDVLGNSDPYSASKASADLATQSYIKSFIKYKKNIKISIARAGNVIGGGDWAEGRLIPDCVRSWSNNKVAILRNPNSTRPWQHVLDVLYGYILLSIYLKKNKIMNGEAFNFGPKIKKNYKVISVVKRMKFYWKKVKWKISIKKNFYESKLLQLNSSKAKKLLNWQCNLNLDKSISFTISWYKCFYNNPKYIYKYSLSQIKDFLKILKLNK